MRSLKILSAAEQVAEHLREEMLAGNLTGEMPGAVALADGLGVNHKTAEAALAALEKDGLLASQGPRRRKRIVADATRTAGKSLRIAIFINDMMDTNESYITEMRHRLQEAGHSPFFTRKSMTELGMDAGRIAKYVEETDADGWVVVAAARPVLERFAEQPVPAFALFGFMRTLGIAGTGPDKRQAYKEAVRELVGLGHRRIVLLARAQRIVPRPGAHERAFIAALEADGIATSQYHLPVWENSREGFHRHLDTADFCTG